MHLRNLVSGVAVATLAASLLAVAGPSSAAPEDPVEVVPSTLPVGDTPTVPWYRSAGHEIVTPHNASIPVRARTAGVPGGGTWLLNARGGWLSHTYENGTWFVGRRDGTRRLGPKSAFVVQLVAADGRTFVDLAVRYAKRDTRKYSTTVRVRRTRDGKVLRTRTFKQTGVQVRAATSSLVALTRVFPRGGNTVRATTFWNQRTGRLSVFRRHQEPGTPAGPFFYQAPAASLSHHLIAVNEPGGQYVRDTRTGRKLWRTSSGESTYRFSPGGTYVVTFDDYYSDYEDGFSPRLMRIRDARTGAVRATYHGLFTYQTDESPMEGPIWESTGTRLLVLAYDGLTQDDEGYSHPSGPAWIRCTIDGACVRVPIALADYVTIPRSG